MKKREGLINKTPQTDFAKKRLENKFILKLFEHLSKDLSHLNLRRMEFLSGKSMKYCKIGAIEFSNLQSVKELELPSGAFRLGLEFGINIGIDAFNSTMKQIDEEKNVSKLVKSKIDIQQLLKKKNIKKNKLLPKQIAQKLKQFKKMGK